jgi:hypothetical protein
VLTDNSSYQSSETVQLCKRRKLTVGPRQLHNRVDNVLQMLQGMPDHDSRVENEELRRLNRSDMCLLTEGAMGSQPDCISVTPDNQLISQDGYSGIDAAQDNVTNLEDGHLSDSRTPRDADFEQDSNTSCRFVQDTGIVININFNFKIAFNMIVSI